MTTVDEQIKTIRAKPDHRIRLARAEELVALAAIELELMDYEWRPGHLLDQLLRVRIALRDNRLSYSTGTPDGDVHTNRWERR